MQDLVKSDMVQSVRSNKIMTLWRLSDAIHMWGHFFIFEGKSFLESDLDSGGGLAIEGNSFKAAKPDVFDRFSPKTEERNEIGLCSQFKSELNDTVNRI